MGEGRNLRRTAAVTMTGVTLAAAAFLGAASPAGASPDPTGYHACDLATGRPDDGPITDVIHHNVEPLLGAGRSGLHQPNCALENYEEIVLDPERQQEFIDSIVGLLGLLG